MLGNGVVMNKKKMEDQELQWQAENAAKDAFISSPEGRAAVKAAKQTLKDNKKRVMQTVRRAVRKGRK